MGNITIKLTPAQAKILWNTIDGAADAGSCDGGCTKQELRALHQISLKLLAEKDKWLSTKLHPSTGGL